MLAKSTPMVLLSAEDAKDSAEFRKGGVRFAVSSAERWTFRDFVETNQDDIDRNKDTSIDRAQDDLGDRIFKREGAKGLSKNAIALETFEVPNAKVLIDPNTPTPATG